MSLSRHSKTKSNKFSDSLTSSSILQSGSFNAQTSNLSSTSEKPIKTPIKDVNMPADVSDKMICPPQEFLIPQHVAGKKGQINRGESIGKSDTSPNPDYMKYSNNMYHSHKLNNISPDQPMQFNFATKYPGMYSSSASNQKFQHSSGQKGFNLIPMHHYPPVNGMVNPFVTDPNHSSSSNQMQQEKLFSFLDPRTAFYPHTIIVQQPMIQQAVFF